MAGIRVLCADPTDEPGPATALDAAGFPTVDSATVADAKRGVDEHDIDCIVTEYDFPDGTGLELVEHVRETAPDTPCVVYTETPPTELDTSRFRGVIVEYMRKGMPDADERLGTAVQDMIDHSAQVGYLLPDDEDERLEALAAYDLEAMDVEAWADRISTLVANHFDVPVAFVGLVEESEENFLGCHGGDWDTTNREDTICTHTVLEQETMVVEDITEDHRFQNNDTLLSLGIRSYAVANMVDSTDHTLGSLCLIDYEPREFSEDQLEDLRRFADEAVEQLELRRELIAAGEGDR